MVFIFKMWTDNTKIMQTNYLIWISELKDLFKKINILMMKIINRLYCQMIDIFDWY